MSFEQFDRALLSIRPLRERDHDLRQDDVLSVPGGPRVAFVHPALPILAERIVEASRDGRAVLFTCGAHVLRQGGGIRDGLARTYPHLVFVALIAHLEQKGF